MVSPLEGSFYSALILLIHFNSTAVKETFPDLSPRELPLSGPGPKCVGRHYRQTLA